MACNIDGFPNPQLTWLKDGQPLPASTRLTTAYDLNTGVARLKLSDAVMNDAGLYACLAENKAGADRTECRLDVDKESSVDTQPIISPAAFGYLTRGQEVQPPPGSPKSDIKPLGPRVVVPLANANVVEGKPVRLACKIEGVPLPSVAWYKNGVALPASSRCTVDFDLVTGVASLKMTDVQPSDSARYEVCAILHL